MADSNSHLARLAEHTATILRGDACQQVAALCYRHDKIGGPEVLLITTRETKRWSIPKGWLIKGLESYEAAEREAWEEAGVRGKVQKKVFGHYTYLKRLQDRTIPSFVEVHLLEVEKIAKRFPEKDQRSFQWLTPNDAANLIEEPELAHLIANLSEPKRAAKSER